MHFSTIPVIAFGLILVSGVQATTSEPESGLMELFRRAEETNPNGDWVDLTAGLMMQGPTKNLTQLTRRNGVERDSTEILVERDLETGTLILPRSWNDVSTLIRKGLPGFVNKHVKRGAKRVSNTMKVIITWYDGYDLLYPSCLSAASWAPTDDSMVGAVTIAWSSKPACGKFVKIRHQSNKKKWIVVRIMDSCAGCRSGSAHIDLTKGAFTKLYDLDVGLVTGLQAQLVDAPEGYTWSLLDIGKYGPQFLS